MGFRMVFGRLLLIFSICLLVCFGCEGGDGEGGSGTDGDADGDTDGDTDTDTDTDSDDGGCGDNVVFDGDEGCDSELQVSTATELRDALSTAAPGTAIVLSSGTYTGEFDVEVSGEEGSYICIRGPADRSAVLDGNFNVSSWQGVLNMESRHHIVVENLEVKNTSASRYGVLMSASSRDDPGSYGCHHIKVRNLHVHDVGEEIIKVQGKGTSHIVVEDCIVHSNEDWSGIDVQGHWGGTPSYDLRPKKVVIRNNLIYDIAANTSGAGVGNEISDYIHVYNNVVLGSVMGLDIGCGNYNVVHNNLITSYAHFNELKDDLSYTAIDLSRYDKFTQSQIDGMSRDTCTDGIAMSGNYMSLIFDNEITDCMGGGDLIMSYNHWIGDEIHNYDYDNSIDYGHRLNLYFRNKIHDNDAYYIIKEEAKQTGGVSYDQMYFGNLFFNNNGSQWIHQHSEDLMFFNNTINSGETVALSEASTDAVIKNNIFLDSDYSVSGDSTGADVSNNYETSDQSTFVDTSSDDYRLDTSGSNACVDTGADLTSVISAKFQEFKDIYNTEYAYYSGFCIDFNFDEDFDGHVQDASWDMGAYYTSE